MAIDELHQYGQAHLDIRLENVCFCPLTGQVILIDLDRSRPKISSANQYSLTYGKSTMYTPAAPEWTAENLDWRQLAIMLFFITSRTTDLDYHKILVPEDSYPFFRDLFQNG